MSSSFACDRAFDINARDGYSAVSGAVTRSGVFTYIQPDGTIRREYRPPDEVESEQTLASLKLLPITLDHPPEMLTPDTVKQYQVGSTGTNIRLGQDGWQHAEIGLHAREALDAIKAGKKQLSLGYKYDRIAEPGVTPDGQAYDFVQRNIRYNHLALVDYGRASFGSNGSASLALDNADVGMYTEPERKTNTVKVEINGKSFDLADEVASELIAERSALKQSLEESQDTGKDLAQKLSVAEKALEAKATAMDELKQKATAVRDEAIKDAVRARVELERSAQGVLGESFDSALDDEALKLACMKSIDPDFDADSVSNDVFEYALKMATKSSADKAAALKQAGSAESNDEGDLESKLNDAVKAAHAKMRGKK